METPWRIELFGWLRAVQGERVVTRFATQKTAALLARLALFTHRTHPREELIDLLWPDADFSAGRASLRQALASLRRQLEPPGTAPGAVLIADRLSVRLNPDAVTTDVAAFEACLKDPARLAEAAALYRGELLPGFYDEWIVDERERLTAVHQAARERLAASATPVPPGAGGSGDRVGVLLAAPGPPTSEQGAASSAPTGRRGAPGLPLQFTRFFGREDEIAHLSGLLRAERLVTLTGPGGAGKTRLALEVARRAADDRRVCFVALADLTDARLIPGAVADALRLPRAVGTDPLEAVTSALAGDAALLLLDNFEHLADVGAAVLQTLRTRLPDVAFLITSRRRLALPGERVVPVAALPVPGGAETPEQLAALPSVQLFLDRAQSARPDFGLTPRTAPALAALCRRLEGSPLALELAAARAQALTPAQMLERLDDRFELLASRRTDKDSRHRSLWATIDWSYGLLPPALQGFWARLSVFRGGFTAEAAACVCEGPPSLESLTQLRERSLVALEEAADEIRFRLLETLREFAAEQLTPGERDSLAARHAVVFRDLAERSVAALSGPAQKQWLDRLEADHENLRVALDWSAAADGGAETGLRLIGALWGFWSARGHVAEGRAYSCRLLARRDAPEAARAEALLCAGNLARLQADFPAARALLDECIALCRRCGDGPHLGRALANLGGAAMLQGDYAAARPALEEALPWLREAGSRQGTAAVLANLAVVARRQGDYAAARPLMEESLAIERALGNQLGIAQSLNGLGVAAYEEGHYDSARAYLEESLQIKRDLGDRHGAANSLSGLANVVFRQGDVCLAQSLAEEGLALHRALNNQHGVAYLLNNLAAFARRRQDWGAARAFLEECTVLAAGIDDKPAVARALGEWANHAAARGCWTRATRLTGASDALRARIGEPLPPTDRPEHDQALETARSVLGGCAFAAAWEAGRAMTAERAVAEALAQEEPEAGRGRKDRAQQAAPLRAPGAPGA